jgi:hypothetical protein
MTAKIFAFPKAGAPTPPQDIPKLIDQMSDELMGEWEQVIKVGRINEFFRSKLSSYANSEVNYINSLDELSKLEIKLGVQPMIFFPETAFKEQLGWIVQLRYGDMMVRTPELASENSARAFAILLHIKVGQLIHL